MGDGIVIVSAAGADIILYSSDSEIDGEISYSAAVRYSGKAAGSDADSEIIAAMDANAEVIAKSGRKVYIGENVKFTIDKDGTVTSEEIK